MSFRRVTPSVAWYRDIFDRVGAQEWMWFGRLLLDDAALAKVFTNPDYECYTLEKDGTDEALLELGFTANGECEILYFGVTPPLIGTGAGRALMGRAIAHAWSKDISRFHLHTCTMDSPQALDFYIRSGFTPIKRDIEVIDDPRVTGILPRSAGPRTPII